MGFSINTYLFGENEDFMKEGLSKRVLTQWLKKLWLWRNFEDFLMVFLVGINIEGEFLC